MNTGKVDVIFKIGMLIFAFVFLLLFYFSIENQRYQFHQQDDIYVFDSKTGITYFLFEADKEAGKPTQWVKISPFEKKEVIPFK